MSYTIRLKILIGCIRLRFRRCRGCQAWVKSEVEVGEILTSVAEEFIASYHDFGDPLPKEVLDSLVEVEERSVVGSVTGFGAARNLITV